MYQTNAFTRHGEHGNALLTRWPVITHQHEDMSDHRFEQRGLLHVEVMFQGRPVHAIVVHLGLIPGSRVRQIQQLQRFIEREIPPERPWSWPGTSTIGAANSNACWPAMGCTSLRAKMPAP